MRRYLVLWFVLATCMLVGLLLSGCMGVSTVTENPGMGSAGGKEVSEPVRDTEPEREIDEPTEAPTEEAEPKDYGVPAEDANLVNPIEADEASLQQGEETYKTNCRYCHGEEGRGDSPAGLVLDPPPADFRTEQVRQLSDGEMFYIITNGVEGSDMPAWGWFDKERHWHLVNYIRSLQE